MIAAAMAVMSTAPAATSFHSESKEETREKPPLPEAQNSCLEPQLSRPWGGENDPTLIGSRNAREERRERKGERGEDVNPCIVLPANHGQDARNRVIEV
jgi:hypothetical protein